MLIFMSFFFIAGVSSFVFKHKHLLLMLLSLEFIIIVLYFIMIVYLSKLDYEYFFSMIYLSMSVCEGVLGLSILVSMIRVHGSDNVLTFSILW
uniref:NADH-ubiquinone oxidoreductase chain 4L n=1 Tax=Callosobruchus chinensis TaxID=146774 RepID=A0A1P8YZJ1_CALCS|nr:NADH dehydrogenase subunit 4L [Callosobruchus chinensis]AST14949.1 NADH dehydrogenase subunit 4L [Callosobruchus chinensis]ATL15419.1 NADH dehydrogenase subunit 4L [Callosobruchus chinensis]